MKKIYFLLVAMLLGVFSIQAQEAEVNLLSSGDFEENFDGWNLFNGDTPAELVDATNPMDETSLKAIKLVADEESSAAYELQFVSPIVTVVEGNQYKLVFDIKSDGTGAGRISTGEGQTTSQYWPGFDTTEEW